MRAVILTAGQGTRLRPMTDDRPKGMVEVSGRPIVEWQIDLMRAAGIDEIALVTGYAAEAVPALGATHFANPEFDRTNMAYSLFCADEFLSGDVIVSYGDIIYSPQVLQAAIDAESALSVVVDLDWEPYFRERFDDPFDDAESLIMGSNGMIADIGRSNPDPSDVQAQYIGLMKFAPSGVEGLRRIFRGALKSGDEIGWGRPARRAFMTDLLQEAVLTGLTVSAVPVRRGWVEIDSLRDFAIAERELPALFSDPNISSARWIR